MSTSRIAADDYQRLRSVLVGSLRAIHPRMNSTEREDVAQRALLRLLQHQKKYEGVESYSPSYIRKAAYHALIDELREVRSRPEIDSEENLTVLPSLHPSPAKWTTSRETGQAIRECLRRLPPPRRLALSLVLLGHTVPEVAALRGLEAKQAENLVYRGRKDVKECLRQKGIEP